MTLFWMMTMINNRFDIISYSFLMYVIKRRDEEGLIYVSNALIDCLNSFEFVELITDFLVANTISLTEEDMCFFQDCTQSFINDIESKKVAKKNKIKNQENIDSVDMRKITKAVILFEQNGLIMGTDYSFHNGKIRMKKECQDKIKKLLGKG